MTAPNRALALDVCRYLDGWLAFRQRYDRVPGVQAAVVHDDEVLLSSAHGMADVERGVALTTSHLFRIASHSKTFTATAVMQLVEAGRLRLDDTLAQWLPALVDSPIGPVTLREALAHSGGVIRDGLDSTFWDLHRPFPDHDELMAMARDGSDVIVRNDRFKYSNVAYSLVGSVIEAVTGRTYAEVVREQIVWPLGLHDTGPELDVDRSDDLAAGYTALSYADRRIPIDHVDTRAMAAATGFYSTASDVVRYAAAHFLGDDRLLSDAAKRQLQRTEWDVPGTGMQYGLGFVITAVGGRRTVGHSGGYPGHITRTLWDPVDRIAVSVLTNAIDGPASVYAPALFTLLALAEGATAARHADEPSRYEGRYANAWGVTDVVSFDGRLFLLSPVGLDPAADAARLEPVGEDEFRIADATGFRSPGERVRFVRGADGAVEHVRIGGGTSVPLQELTAAVAGRTRVEQGRGLRT
jgi:CubicO group peptidase (beta-lactamase class C family)